MTLQYKPIDLNARLQTLDEASMQCFFLEYNGMKGWRLPTEFELAVIKGERERNNLCTYLYKTRHVWTREDLHRSCKKQKRPGYDIPYRPGYSRLLAVKDV